MTRITENCNAVASLRENGDDMYHLSRIHWHNIGVGGGGGVQISPSPSPSPFSTRWAMKNYEIQHISRSSQYKYIKEISILWIVFELCNSCYILIFNFILYLNKIKLQVFSTKLSWHCHKVFYTFLKQKIGGGGGGNVFFVWISCIIFCLCHICFSISIKNCLLYLTDILFSL